MCSKAPETTQSHHAITRYFISQSHDNKKGGNHIKLELFYQNEIQKENLDILLGSYKNLWSKNLDMQAELLRKNEDILRIQREMDEIRHAQERARVFVDEVLYNIQRHSREVDEIQRKSDAQKEELARKFDELVQVIKSFVLDDSQQRIKQALEKNDSHGLHLLLDYEDKLHNLTQVLRRGSQYLQEARDIEANTPYCCICLENFSNESQKSALPCGHDLFH